MKDPAEPVTKIPTEPSQISNEGNPPVPVGAQLLELVPVPVSDIDNAISFYRDRVGFRLDVDVTPAPGMRFVQLTPPRSACSIMLAHGQPRPTADAGGLPGLHLVVADIHAARDDLLGRGVDVSEIEDVGGGVLYAHFADPDGNPWSLQYMPWRVSS
jgi:predicted enzyme related to lactoylglutathione lyase